MQEENVNETAFHYDTMFTAFTKTVLNSNTNRQVGLEEKNNLNNLSVFV